MKCKLGIVATLLCLPLHAGEPQLQRVRIATITTPQLDQVERDYARWLGYTVRERGRISKALASSWDATAVTNRRYILMSPDTAPDVYIRAIEIPASKNLITRTYIKPLTTHGWNAIEIIIDNLDALLAELKDSPFKWIAGPAPLSAYPTIHAFQVLGPSGEIIYFTAETGDRSKSILPLPNGKIGRIFIMVNGGPNIEQMLDLYADKFGLTRPIPRQRVLTLLNNAQHTEPNQLLPIATLRLKNFGNFLELDGYSSNATPRPREMRNLPLGIASASFSVPNLETLDLKWIRPPAVQPGLAYLGRRTASLRGPAGELLELIEE